MKNLIFLLILVITGLALPSCQSRYKETDCGTVSFNHVQRFRMVKASDKKDIRPASIVVTIEDNNGVVVARNKKLSFHDFHSLLREKMNLRTGRYKLTQFALLDDAGETIYATPVEGTDLANFVSDPLPVDFSISECDNTRLILQVLAVNKEDKGHSLDGGALSLK